MFESNKFKEGVLVKQLRLDDYDISSGVYIDMTKYGWEVDIFIIDTPIWLG